MLHQCTVYNNYPENGGEIIRFYSREDIKNMADEKLKYGGKNFTARNLKTKRKPPNLEIIK